MLKNEIGKRLRVVIGMQSQKEFASDLGTTPQTLNGWLAGRGFPSEEFLLKLLHLKRVNLNWLIAGEGEVYIDQAKNLSEIEKIPALVGMKNLTDQFIHKVAETIEEYHAKTKQLEERKKAKKKH